ncbi:MAG: ArdC-like ssDNA-binding domain-containing protein [Planctomycetota bacterium]
MALKQNRGDVYQEVTDRVIEALERGVPPWRSPLIATAAGDPRNGVSKKPYRGVNIFLLLMTAMSRGYTSPYWLTFKQARSLDGSVRKGEKGTPIIFWKSFEKVNPDIGEPEKIVVARGYRVFNEMQCDLPNARYEPPPTPKPAQTEDVPAADDILNGWPDFWGMLGEGPQPAYRPSADHILMPVPSNFVSKLEWYCTVFHETVHATGHSKRLDRDGITKPQPFGSAGYAREELIAELGAAFLCARAGIISQTFDNSAAYLGNWIKRLRDDPKLIVQAAGKAQQAVDLILGEQLDAISE